MRIIGRNWIENNDYQRIWDYLNNRLADYRLNQINDPEKLASIQNAMDYCGQRLVEERKNT